MLVAAAEHAMIRVNRKGNPGMSKLRTLIVALAAVLAAGLASPAKADEGIVRIQFIKAGWIIGGAAGSGILVFHGRNYEVSVGGLTYGLTFGGSQTSLRGRVTNITRPSDIEGVYGAAGAGATVIRGPQAIVLTNQKGAILELSGIQTGLMLNLDLSGLALTLK